MSSSDLPTPPQAQLLAALLDGPKSYLDLVHRIGGRAAGGPTRTACEKRGWAHQFQTPKGLVLAIGKPGREALRRYRQLPGAR